jgi:WD40 repeat protein
MVCTSSTATLAALLTFMSVPASPAADKNESARTDSYGDALPAGALQRLGTVRWRSCARFLAFTPDGKTVVTGDVAFHGDAIRCWDTATGKESGGFRVGHILLAFALSPDGKTLALNSGEDPKGIDLVGVPDGKEIRRCEEISTDPDWLDFSRDGKALAAVDDHGAVRLFDVETGKTVLQLTGSANRSYSATFSPDGKRLALVGRDNTLRILEIAAKRELFKLRSRGDGGPPPAARFSPDGRRLAWAGDDAKTFALWDAETGEPVRQFRGSTERIGTVRFSPDGKRVASADARDEAIRLWDVETGKELLKIAASCGSAGAFAFSPDGKWLASAADWQGVVHLWDVETGKELSQAGEHKGHVCSAGFSPDGRTAVTACIDQVVRTWDADRGAVLRRVETGEGVSPLYQIAFSRDRRTAIIGGFDDPIDLWDLEAGKKRVRLDGEGYKPWKVVFAPDGRTVAANGSFDGVQLWDAPSGKAASRIGAQARGIVKFFFSPDGKTLVTENRDPQTNRGEAVIWDVGTGKELRRWSLQHGLVYDMQFSPDGRMVATAGSEEVNVWDAATGKKMPPFILAADAPAAGVMNCLAFSPDGKTLAAGSLSGVIYLWEVGTTKPRAVFTGHRNEIASLDFSPDGARLISGSSDTTALIWDLTGLADEKGPKTLNDKQLASLWDDVADADAGKAWRAGWRLAADPAASLPFLQKHLRPAEIDAKQVALWLAALDGDDFEGREKASRELANFGDLVGGDVRKALEGTPSPEARRRLEELAAKLDRPVADADQARALRGVEALEHIGTAEARRLLDELGRGAAGARLTRDAKAAAARLAGRSEP